MKMPKILRASGSRFKKNFRGGSGTMALTVLFVCVLIVINLIVQKLPASMKKLDMSESQIYTISAQAQAVLKALDQPVVIHVIAEEASLDPRLTTFLDHFTAQSEKVSWDLTDPVRHPNVLSRYQTEADTLVVENTDTGRTQIVAVDEILIYDEMMYYYYGTKEATDFDGEGQLISAIRLLNQESQASVALTNGHQEAELSEAVTSLFAKAGYSSEAVNLLSAGAIPADCGLLIINAPQKDLSEDELTMIREYLQTGGHLMILLDGGTGDLPRLSSLMEEYGLKLEPGIVGDMERYYQNNAASFFPILSSDHAITYDLDSDEDLVLLVNGRGMKQIEPTRETITVSPFMTTSLNGLCFDDSEEVEGQFILGATAEEITDTTVGSLSVISAANLINSQITDRFTSIANLDVFMRAVAWNFGEADTEVIAAKSLDVTYNLIADAGLWSLFMTVLIPLTLLTGGLIVWLRRRRA